MSIFSNPFSNDYAKELAAEERSKNFAREQLGFQAGVMEDVQPLQQQQERIDLLKWQQDLTDEEKALIYKLKRLVEIEGEWKAQTMPVGRNEKGELIYHPLPPYLNELGISMVVDQCRPLLSRNLINSNLSEERILKMLEYTCNSIADNLADNFDIYNVRFVDFDIIIRLIKNTIISAPFRALNGWNKKIDATINKRIEAFHEGIDPMPRKKILGIF